MGSLEHKYYLFMLVLVLRVGLYVFICRNGIVFITIILVTLCRVCVCLSIRCGLGLAGNGLARGDDGRHQHAGAIYVDIYVPTCMGDLAIENPIANCLPCMLCNT